MTAHEGIPEGRTLREAFRAMPYVTYPADASPVVKDCRLVRRRRAGAGSGPPLPRARRAAPAGPRFHVEAGSPAGPDDNRMELRVEGKGSGSSRRRTRIPSTRSTASSATSGLTKPSPPSAACAGCARRSPGSGTLSDFLVGSLRTSRGFSGEEYVRQAARLGFTHCTVNGLAEGPPFESGPPGDVYSWFYDYSPRSRSVC